MTIRKGGIPATQLPRKMFPGTEKLLIQTEFGGETQSSQFQFIIVPRCERQGAGEEERGRAPRNKARFRNEVSATMKAMESSVFVKLETDIQSGYRRSRSYHGTNWVTEDGPYRENPISNSLFFSARATPLRRFYIG